MINLEAEEKIILEVRKHWIIFVFEIIGLVLASFIPIVLFSIFGSLKDPVIFYSLGFNINDYSSISFFSSYNLLFISFVYFSWLLILWITCFIFWTDYYLDVWIITNKKMVDIEQRGLFNRQISVLSLDKIQDISFKVSGLLPTILNIGSISVQTAAEEKLFTIRGIPNPVNTHSIMNQTLVDFRNNASHKI